MFPKQCCIARALREPVVFVVQERKRATDFGVCVVNAVFAFE